jgi:predicted negative regulator of RcsB-dependent stress response
MSKPSQELVRDTLTEIEHSITAGQYTDARQALRRFARVETDRHTRMQTQLLLGKSYVSEGKWTEALRILTSLAAAAAASKEYETAAYAHHYTGDSYIYKGDLGAAAKQYRRSLDVGEKHKLSGLLLALNFSATGMR